MSILSFDVTPGGSIYVDIGQIELIDTDLDHNVTNGNGSPGGSLTVLAGKLAQGNLDVSRSLVLANKTFGNRSSGSGIAVVSDESPAEVTLTDSMVSSNSTDLSDSGGAGIAGRGLGDGQPRVPVDVIAVRSIISGNTAHGNNSRGGGIHVEYGSQEADRSTIANNTTACGTDGVRLTSGVDAELTLANNLMVQTDAGTTGCSADAIDSTPTYATDTSCESIFKLADSIGLGALLPNGGPTRTHSIPADSVAIDAADCAGDYGVNIDLRGQQRPGKISGACDAGAFEYQTSGSVFWDRFEAP